MSNPPLSTASSLAITLAQIQVMTLELAVAHCSDREALMAILRQIEGLHRQICENYFVPLLPENRHELYSLLRDIEENGGWPYIERMRLRALVANLKLEDQFNSPRVSPPPGP